MFSFLSKIVKYDYINVMEIGFYLRKNALVDYYFPMQLKWNKVDDIHDLSLVFMVDLKCQGNLQKM